MSRRARLQALEGARANVGSNSIELLTHEELATLLAGGTIAASMEEVARRPRPSWMGKQPKDMTDNELDAALGWYAEAPHAHA